MKKKLCIAATIIATVSIFTGCGNDYDFVTLPDYIGLPISTIEEVSITDAEINARIQSNLSSHTIYQEANDRPVQSGDMVNMDIEGRVNDKPYGNSDVYGYDMKIGIDSLIPGFDNAIIGQSTGAEFIVNLTCPADYYNEEIAGKDIEYSVKINGIRYLLTPELTDSFIKQISSTASTVKEYELEVRKQLENEKAVSATTSDRDQVWNYIVDNTEVTEYPQSMLNKEVEAIENQYIKMADTLGISLDLYVADYLGLPADDFKQQNVNMAQYNITEYAILMVIAENENLIPTSDEYVTYYQDLLVTYGYNDVNELLSSVDEQLLQKNILLNIVKDFLVANAVQTDK